MESWPSLKLPSLVVPRGKWLPFSQVGGVHTSERDPHWWHVNGVPNNVTRMQLTQTQVVCFISCQGLCAQIKWLYLKFQFTATNFMSMAAKSSDLMDEIPGANLQMEGHADVPPQSAKDLQELEASDSSPSYSLSWSPARRLPSSCPNTKHCLEINVTWTEELEAVPPPSHSWTTPLMEDMLHDARTRLTKVVMIGPGRQFFSMGDIQWERDWQQMRPEMQHSYSQEQVHGLENQPTSLLTPWQSKRLDRPLFKL